MEHSQTPVRPAKVKSKSTLAPRMTTKLSTATLHLANYQLKENMQRQIKVYENGKLVEVYYREADPTFIPAGSLRRAKSRVANGIGSNQYQIKPRTMAPSRRSKLAKARIKARKSRSSQTSTSGSIIAFFSVLALVGVLAIFNWLNITFNTPVIPSSPTVVQAEEATESAEIAPTPSPTPEPTPAPEKYSWVTPTKATPTTDNQKEVVRLIEEIWGEDAKLGKQLAFCESSWGEANTTLSSARGVFQFIKSTWIAERGRMGADADLELRFNIEENIKTGYSHFKRNGLEQPWAESVHCVKTGSH